MNAEAIPPLPELEISQQTKKVLDQPTVNHAMRIIYERRPDFFRRSAERDKKWESDPTQDEEAWVHDEFTKDFHSFIRDEVSKELNLSDNTTRNRVLLHARAVARLMYGMPIQNITR